MPKSDAVLKLFAVALIVFSLAASPLMAHQAPAPERASIMQVDDGDMRVNVTDEAGRPIQGANVTISGNATYYNHTGADGGLWIPNLANGTYTINASMSGYLNGSATGVITWKNTTNLTVVVTGGWYTGFVLEQDNTPIENATVEVATGTDILWAMSQPDGSFNLTGIPTGSYIAVVFSQIHTAVSEIISVSAGTETVRPLPFKLFRNTGWITGYVFDGTVPVSNASISIMLDTIMHTVLSGDVGNYELSGVPAGNYTVRASKEGYLDAEIVNVTVVNGVETAEVNISLIGKPATIAGSVAAITSSGNVLLYGALVEILGTGRNATTGTGGLYEILNVPVGTWVIRATAPGYEDNEISGVIVGRGAELDVNIVLTPKPGQLMGTVRAADTYQVLQGYRVTISGPLQRETYTNDQGQYVFAGLTPGNYTLTVVGNTSETRYSPYIAYDIEVEPEGVTSHDVSLGLAKQALGGFIFGLDLPHSFMVLALIITLILLVLAVYIRLKRFQTLGKEGGAEGETKEEAKAPPIS